MDDIKELCKDDLINNGNIANLTSDNLEYDFNSYSSSIVDETTNSLLNSFKSEEKTTSFSSSSSSTSFSVRILD
jgi:hypothetical protein